MLVLEELMISENFSINSENELEIKGQIRLFVRNLKRPVKLSKVNINEHKSLHIINDLLNHIEDFKYFKFKNTDYDPKLYIESLKNGYSLYLEPTKEFSKKQVMEITYLKNIDNYVLKVNPNITRKIKWEGLKTENALININYSGINLSISGFDSIKKNNFHHQTKMNQFIFSIYIKRIISNQSSLKFHKTLNSFKKQSTTYRKEFEDKKKSDDVMAYLLECFNAPDAIKRRDGDPQIEQLATFILGRYSSAKEEIKIIDVGAGYGDLVKAINNSGIVSKFNYIPIEIDKGKWPEIESRCKSINKLKYNPPSDNIEAVEKADIVFFVNVFHELNLNQRVDLLYGSFKLIQKKGEILIHEVVILPKLENAFFMWDEDDFKLIMSKINSNIEIKTARTYSRPEGWPLHTIIITYNDGNLITKEEIRSAIISSLKDIKQNWLNYESTDDFIKIEDLEMKKKTQAFLMAQNRYNDLWLKENNAMNEEEQLNKEKIFDQNIINNPLERKILVEQDPKFFAKFKRLKREISEYFQLVEHEFLSDYEINYSDLNEISKLPVLFEMLKDIIVKNENLRMIGYSNEERNIQLKSLRDYFSRILND